MLEPQAISQPNRRFFKRLTYDCSSALNYEVPEEKHPLVSKTAAPQQFW